MRSAHRDVSLDGDSQGHVDGGAEGDGRHGVQHAHTELREEGRGGEEVVDTLKGGVGVDRNVGQDISKHCHLCGYHY